MDNVESHGLSKETVERDARIRDEAFERGVAIGRAEALGEHTLEALTERELWCCVCLFIPADQRPEGWEDSPLTVIDGSLVCADHAMAAGANKPLGHWRAWRRIKEA